MRKLTGYIGAIIIVFALMGSILLGYALNINGTTATVNAYDPVTDVSGLYTHSQEPAYIDYNPASNYIGYSTTVTNTDNSNLGYQKLTGNATISKTNMKITINGNTRDIGNAHYLFIVDNVCWAARYGADINVFMYYGGGTMVVGTATDITINVSGTTTTVTFNNDTHTFTNVGLTVINCDQNVADYGLMTYQSGITKDVYVNDINQIIGTVETSWFGGSVGNTVRGFDSNNIIPVNVCQNTQNLPDGIKKTTIGGWGASGGLFYPLNFYSDMGINYIESNRVNNYPIIRSDASTATETTTLTVGNLSATDYWPEVPNGWLKTGYLIYETQPVYPHDMISAPYYYTTINLPDYNYGATMLHQYKLSDILVNYTIPIGTQTLKITTNSNDIRAYPYYNLDANIIGFVNASNNGFIQTFNDIANKKDYLIYDISNNVCTVYNYNGVALFTNTPENIGVIFCDNTGAKYMRYSHFETVNDITSGYFDMDNRPVPFITITASIYNPADIDYIDITKGYSIKNSNVNNTIWDNEYSNGDIKLLFRAENTSATYHNDIIIGDNTVSVDYSSNRYLITLNSGDPVDIGTWRNIVLDIDLINGKLSAIPVKTFNSYTNVELMNTIIPVGDLVNPAPTNSIEWAPTSNSLMFNVYSTSVNMDTYGVVMVNPSLNIQDYFTNLNNFYRMKFYNFSTYGNSITINGQTSTVTNGTVTYEGETVKLKDINVTYANGHTYIGDSNLEIDLGETTDYNISMTGAWYFQTMLEQGYTELKNIYEWDWGAFILDNTQFCIIYMGLALVGLVIARRFCNLSIIDYSVLVVSAIIAFTVQVVA